MHGSTRADALRRQLDDVLEGGVDFGTADDRAAMTALLATGKRIRAQIVLAIAEAAGGVDDAAAVGAAAGVELVHLASLVHDDLIDSSSTRRGIPALHVAVGEHRSILLGDTINARGALLVARADPAAAATLLSAVEKLNRGQLLESDLTVADRDVFLEYISLKTAALIEAAATIGGQLGGLSGDRLAAAGAFGWHFGMMFQMADDLIDFAGSAELMGKPVHQDLGNSVFSLPIQEALAVHPGTAGLPTEQAYRQMRDAVDWASQRAEWREHADEARSCLTAALGAATPASMLDLIDTYSGDALAAHAIPGEKGER